MVLMNAPGFTSSVSGSIKKILYFSAVASLILALSACNFMPSFGRDRGAEEPGLRADELKTDITVEEARALAKPASPDDGFSVNSTTLQTENNNGLQPARGLNTRRLFAETIRDDDDRFARVETAVQTIRDEIDELSPSIKRLIAVEKDIQELSSQLQVLIGSEGGSPELTVENLENDQGAIAQAMGAPPESLTPPAPTQPPMLMPVQQPTGAPLKIAPPPPPPPPMSATQAPPVPAAPLPSLVPPPAPAPAATPPGAPLASTPPATTPAMTTSGPRLVMIRLADHPGKTRLVLESNAAMSYSADLDNNEKILTLVFDKGSSDPSLASLPMRSRLIKSVSITPQANGGFVAAITLSKDSRMLDQGQLPPGSVSPNHRIYIDLAS